MLGGDYQRQLGQLMSSLPPRIDLPEAHEDFFEQSGASSSFPQDKRASVRTRVRTHGVLWVENALPAFPRYPAPSAIYTGDFSKTGFGFVADEQYFPGEEVRILLATFWMRVTVRRSRRLGPNCFEVGSELTSRHDPSEEAFEDILAEA